MKKDVTKYLIGRNKKLKEKRIDKILFAIEDFDEMLTSNNDLDQYDLAKLIEKSLRYYFRKF